MPTYRFVVQFKNIDPRAVSYLRDAHTLGFNDLRRIQCHEIYFIEG